MTEEKEAKFEFLGRQTSYAWLKLLEGGDAGMRLAVPRRHDDYDEATRQGLEEASEGERLAVTLTAAPEVETSLRPTNIEPANGTSDTTRSVASD